MKCETRICRLNCLFDDRFVCACVCVSLPLSLSLPPHRYFMLRITLPCYSAGYLTRRVSAGDLVCLWEFWTCLLEFWSCLLDHSLILIVPSGSFSTFMVIPTPPDLTSTRARGVNNDHRTDTHAVAAPNARADAHANAHADARARLPPTSTPMPTPTRAPMPRVRLENGPAESRAPTSTGSTSTAAATSAMAQPTEAEWLAMERDVMTQRAAVQTSKLTAATSQLGAAKKQAIAAKQTVASLAIDKDVVSSRLSHHLSAESSGVKQSQARVKTAEEKQREAEEKLEAARMTNAANLVEKRKELKVLHHQMIDAQAALYRL